MENALQLLESCLSSFKVIEFLWLLWNKGWHDKKAENTASSEPTKQNHYTRAAKPPVKQQITLLSFSQIHSCLQQEK